MTFPTFNQVQAPGPGTDLTQDMVLHAQVGGAAGTVATDLQGNVLWYYDSTANNFPNYAMSLVPCGTLFLLGNFVDGLGGTTTLRQVDLAGDTLRETNVDAINAELTALGQHSITTLNHDAQLLPNGDTAVVASNQRTINVNGVPTTYVGNMILVLDRNFQVAWAWDAFNWLDTNRLPTDGEGPGDWLHANSVAWSPADGNLIVSLRHQDWVIKIDYANGTGDGHVIWRLGQGGDFTVNDPSSDPYPWFSHQHDARYVNDSTIVLFDDGNLRHDTTSSKDSRGQEWIVDEQTMTATLVVNADLGNYSAALGAAQRLPNGSLDFTSGIVGQSIEVLPDGTQTYVLDMSGSQYRSYFMSTLYGSPTSLYDSGFEDPPQGMGPSAYQYRPTGSAWSFSGDAGVTGNGSGFTSGNPNAPQDSQVAFLQKTGSISQAVDFATAGSYQISFSAAQRGNYDTGNEQFQVQVDGTAVGTITPASTSYANYTTAAFNVTAGSHTISFVGVDPSGVDYSAFLDQVSIDNVAPTGFTDPGFENPSQGTGALAYTYRPTGSAWSFSGDAGLAGNGSNFTSGNPNAPQGSQVAFLQKTGSIGQVVDFGAAGSYQINLSAAQRANFGTSNEQFQVQVDGTVVDTFTPAGTTYAAYTTAAFSVMAGSHTITFVGVDPSGSDYTALIDQVDINWVG